MEMLTQLKRHYFELSFSIIYSVTPTTDWQYDFDIILNIHKKKKKTHLHARKLSL
jgi:hypothetical protein